jgi:hypothetical protein
LQGLTYTGQQEHRINADIHTLTGIGTHDPVLQRAKTVHAVDGAVTVIGKTLLTDRGNILWAHEKFQYPYLRIATLRTRDNTTQKCSSVCVCVCVRACVCACVCVCL